MKKAILFLAILILVVSCTKEVIIDIPGYSEQLVIDGRIETNSPPFVLLSRSKDIYAPTNLEAYLASFVKGAKVTVSNGTKTVVLDEICSDNLPPGSEVFFEDLFGIPAAELAGVNFCAYTTFDTDIWGEIGKTYTLKVEYDGKEYNSTTEIVQPVGLNELFWKGDSGSTEYGFGWANLTDPSGVFNGYFMEVKRINIIGGKERDDLYEPIFNPANNDEFFDGTTFDFGYGNPQSFKDTSVAQNVKGYYKVGDSVAIKFSSLDRNAHRFLYDKYIQLYNGGNPFAVPTNVKTNITGGALGAWLGYSPYFDTLYCQP
jgi:hypothetical protein